jgi:hypothetical protein
MSWLDGLDKCIWPTRVKIDKLRRLQKSAAPPGKDWETYQVRIMTVKDSFERAIKKLSKAQCNSDLDTTDMDIHSRHRKRRHIQSSSSDDDTANIPKAPPLQLDVDCGNSLDLPATLSHVADSILQHKPMTGSIEKRREQNENCRPFTKPQNSLWNMQNNSYVNAEDLPATPPCVADRILHLRKTPITSPDHLQLKSTGNDQHLYSFYCDLRPIFILLPCFH